MNDTKNVMTATGSVAVPLAAVFFPDAAISAGYQMRALSEIQDESGLETGLRQQRFAGKVKDWLFNAGRDRDNGLPIPPKPLAENVVLTSVVRTVTTDTEPVAGLYIWNQDGSPVGVCPDLPAAAPPHQTIPGPTTVMNVPAGDTMPIGYIATAPDGSLWQKQQSGTPFGTTTFYARIS